MAIPYGNSKASYGNSKKLIDLKRKAEVSQRKAEVFRRDLNMGKSVNDITTVSHYLFKSTECYEKFEFVQRCKIKSSPDAKLRIHNAPDAKLRINGAKLRIHNEV